MPWLSGRWPMIRFVGSYWLNLVLFSYPNIFRIYLCPSSTDAPVDSHYLLRGSQNVYVTGGALWPQGGSWNPTLTMVALSQHLADLLVKKV